MIYLLALLRRPPLMPGLAALRQRLRELKGRSLPASTETASDIGDCLSRVSENCKVCTKKTGCHKRLKTNARASHRIDYESHF
jgi:hypothetical protein